MLIEFHYSKDDPDCSGDYYEVWIKDGGKIIQKYGDYYHDKGAEKASAFIDGLSHVTGVRYPVKYKHIADLEV